MDGKNIPHEVKEFLALIREEHRITNHRDMAMLFCLGALLNFVGGFYADPKAKPIVFTLSSLILIASISIISVSNMKLTRIRRLIKSHECSNTAIYHP